MGKKIVLELETKADGTIGTLDQIASGLDRVAASEKKVADNTQDVTEQLAKLREQIQQTDVKSDQYKELTEQYKKLGGSLTDLVPKTANLKQEQRELKKALLAGQEALGIEKYTQLTQRLGEVNDQLKDIAESAGQNAGPPLENLKNISGGLTDRLKNLDFEGLSQDVRNFAGNIKNVSFKGIIDGVKGLGGAFASLGKALLSNPVFAVAAAIIALGFAVKAFIDSEREDVQKLNAELDKGTAKRKDAERLAFAQAAGDTQKLTQLKLQSNAQDLADTRTKINNLVNLQKSYVGLSEEQEVDLANLRDKYRSQEIDREIIKIETLNALNAKRTDLQTQFEQRNLDERALAEAQLTNEFIKQKEELEKLGATAEDFEKLDEVFATRFQKLRKGFADTDKAAAQSRADAAKAKQDALIAEQKAARDAIQAAQNEFDSLTKTAQQNELDAVAEKYKKLKEQAEKAKVDTTQIVELQGKEEQAIREKYAKQLLDLTQQAKDEQQAVIEEIQEEALLSQRSAQQKELDELGEIYFEKITLLEDAEQDATALREEWDKKRKAITDKYAQEDVEKEKERQQAVLIAQNAGQSARAQALNTELAALKADYDARIALAKKYGQDVSALEAEYTEAVKIKRIQAAAETVQMWADTASAVLDALSAVNEAKAAELGKRLTDLDKEIEGARTKQQRDELIKRRKVLEQEQRAVFEKNKRAQIAQTTIVTLASATAAFASQLIPGDPTSAVRGAVAAAAALVSGFANVRKIKQTQFEASQPPASSDIPEITGGGGGGGETGESTAPQFNPLVLDFLNNRPEQQTPRAYVLAGDVEKATQARDRVEELARL
jgi:hypothetical protein